MYLLNTCGMVTLVKLFLCSIHIFTDWYIIVLYFATF